MPGHAAHHRWVTRGDPDRGGRPGPVLVCAPPPPPRVLKDSGAGSATNKCPERKLSGAKGANFFSYNVFILKILKIFVENSYLY